MIRLILIRHAQSTNNALWKKVNDRVEYEEGRSADPDLSALGEAECERFRESSFASSLLEETNSNNTTPEHKLPKIVVRSSPMKRTLKTSEAVCRNLRDANLEFTLECDPLLYEVDGLYEKNIVLSGQTCKEIQKKHPDVKKFTRKWEDIENRRKGWYEHALTLQRLTVHDLKSSSANGLAKETYDQAKARVSMILNDIIEHDMYHTDIQTNDDQARRILATDEHK
eukprot:g4217.t1